MALRVYDKTLHAGRYWLLRHLPPCKELAPVLSRSLERPLTLRERAVVRLHLWVCRWCVHYLAQLYFVRATLRARAARVADDADPAAPALSAAARARLKRSLKPPGR